MVALIATPTRELIDLQDSIRASWTAAERKQRALVANVKQLELLRILRSPRQAGAPAIERLFHQSAYILTPA